MRPAIGQRLWVRLHDKSIHEAHVVRYALGDPNDFCVGVLGRRTTRLDGTYYVHAKSGALNQRDSARPVAGNVTTGRTLVPGESPNVHN